jgi:hypothetical protein
VLKLSPIPGVQQQPGAYPGKGEISDADRGRLREIGQNTRNRDPDHPRQ